MSIIDDLFKKKNKEIPEFKDENIKKTQSQTEDESDTIAAIAAAVAVMDEEREVVAAITALIACMLEKSTSDFIVRNIKRTSDVHSLWALRGRM